MPHDADPGVVVRCYGTTDVGHTREHNEDTFLVADLEAGHRVLFDHATETVAEGAHGVLFLVADGMGGAAAGEVASDMAASLIFDHLLGAWRDDHEPTGDGFAARLRDAVVSANGAIHARARAEPELRGMGTTATVAGLVEDTLYLAQVGDSRAYLLRDGKLTQLTKDQSLMQRLVEAGELTPEEAERSDRRNIILQALGPEQNVTVDLTHQPIRLGDTLILCSDGLSGVVRPEDLAEIARGETDPAVLAHELVARANELGGPDNITVVVAHFGGGALTASQEEDAIGHKAYPLPGTLGSEEERPERKRPTPIKSDPTPSYGIRTSEYPQARFSDGPIPPDPEDPDAVHARRERAKPVMLMLVLLGILAVAYAVVRLVAFREA